MSTIEKRSFSLPSEHAAFIDAQVASGAYASGSEVIRAGLRCRAHMRRAAKLSVQGFARCKSVTPPWSDGCARKWRSHTMR